MSKYWSKLALSLQPYIPGEQPSDKKYIKLNTNENPYPPSPSVLNAIREAAENLKLYPNPNADELRDVVAAYYGLQKEQVFAGNGSDEILAFCFMAFFDPERVVFFPDITYSFYPVYARIFRINYEKIPLNEDFTLPLEKFFRENGGIIFPNPNAPTGNYLTPEQVEKILLNNPNSIVIVDEAYIDFGGESAVQFIGAYPNLLVVQTLSKSRSLAGLRVGLAMGQEGLIKALEAVKGSINSYTLDRLALSGAAAAFRDKAYFELTRRKVIATRERVSSRLQALGFKVIPSLANFVFISHPAVNAGVLFLALKERGVLTRYFNQPRIENFLRVSIGSDEEMDIFLNNISEILQT